MTKQEELRKEVSKLVERVDHLKTPETPDGNPYHVDNLADQEAVDHLLSLINSEVLSALDELEGKTEDRVVREISPSTRLVEKHGVPVSAIQKVKDRYDPHQAG